MIKTKLTIIVPGNVQPQITQEVIDDQTTTQPPADTGNGESTGNGGTTAPPATVARQASLMDFGAKGDDATDDGPAIQAALNKAASSGLTVIVPPLRFNIKTPIVAQIAATAVDKWGLIGPGTFVSNLVNGEDVITINAGQGYVRNMTLSNFSIRGSAKDGAGLVLRCTGGGWSQNLIFDTVIENMGRDGLVVEGEFFESSFIANRFMDCHNGSGVVLANLAGGKNISSLRFLGFNIAQCGHYGLIGIGRDNNWNAPQDTVLEAGYIRQCGQGGVRFYLGGYMRDMLFENNCTSSGDAHVQASGPFWASQCRGDMSMSSAKATYLFSLDSASGNHEATIRDCVHRDNGWNGTTKLAKLGGAHYSVIYDSSGDIDGTGGGYTRYSRGKSTDVAAS